MLNCCARAAAPQQIEKLGLDPHLAFATDISDVDLRASVDPSRCPAHPALVYRCNGRPLGGCLVELSTSFCSVRRLTAVQAGIGSPLCRSLPNFGSAHMHMHMATRPPGPMPSTTGSFVGLRGFAGGGGVSSSTSASSCVSMLEETGGFVPDGKAVGMRRSASYGDVAFGCPQPGPKKGRQSTAKAKMEASGYKAKKKKDKAGGGTSAISMPSSHLARLSSSYDDEDDGQPVSSFGSPSKRLCHAASAPVIGASASGPAGRSGFQGAPPHTHTHTHTHTLPECTAPQGHLALVAHALYHVSQFAAACMPQTGRDLIWARAFRQSLHSCTSAVVWMWICPSGSGSTIWIRCSALELVALCW